MDEPRLVLEFGGTRKVLLSLPGDRRRPTLNVYDMFKKMQRVVSFRIQALPISEQ